MDLVRQGYSVAHAAKVTGWTAPVIVAQEKPQAKPVAPTLLLPHAESRRAVSVAHTAGRRIGASSGKPRSHRCSLSVWARMLCSCAGQSAMPSR